MSETDGGLAAELNTILPGSDPLKNLHVVRTGLTGYTVLSARNGSVTRHSVVLDEPSCTCQDFEYNTDDDHRQVCAHYAKAMLDASDVETSDIAISEIASLTQEARDLAMKAEAALEGAEEANVAAREREAAAVQENPSPSPAEREPDGQAAHDAAERLQEAFDSHVDGMDTQAHDGLVWINKTPDAPDYTFKAFLQDPQAVNFLPPDENDTPGEYWKNAIEPENVDDYIQEVLE